MQKPRNIIILVADSLRYDSVFNTGVQLPYIQSNGTTFTEARSGGCWTLPATASIFTGMLPHEHGATAQTRGIHTDIPTLAEQMKAKGYRTYQVTANIATTDIFGLHRGFDEVRRIWKLVPAKFTRIQELLVLVGKPRLREKLFSRDMLMNKMSEDLEMSKTWLQHTFHEVFNEARKIIAENEKKGVGSFIFLNLMETHFPYHTAPTFKLSADGIYNKLKEVVGLFHAVNQTFLKREKLNISRKTLEILKKRQQTAWLSLAPHIDAFCREMHEDKENLIVFGADHGENFGETGWVYHFSNVTDAGNKVPLFWLSHREQKARTIDHLVSTRHLYNSLLKEVGYENNFSLLDSPERSTPILSSYWYNNKGQTLEKYKYNQIAILHENHRFLLRDNTWFETHLHDDYDEPIYTPTPTNANPIEELVQDKEQKAYYKQTIENFKIFSSKIKK